MASARDDQSTASSETEVQEIAAPSASHTMMLHDHDQLLLGAGAEVSKDLGQIALVGALQKTDALFTSIMDPKNEDTKKLIRDYLHEPMSKIYGKFMATVESIDVQDPTAARQQIVLAKEVLSLTEDAREMALDHVYQNLQRQVDSFAANVDVYNKKMKETFAQALQLYQDRIETELQVRAQVLKQKKEEHSFMLEAFAAEGDAEAARQMQRLSVQQKVDEHAAQQAEREQERQRKRDEQEHLKAEREIEREQKQKDAELAREARKAALEHEKVMKQLEAQAKKGQITREERDGVLRELQSEMARYNSEFALAQEAMRNAIANRRTCVIEHTAPKIDWGKPPDVPPRVIPGHVSWRLA